MTIEGVAVGAKECVRKCIDGHFGYLLKQEDMLILNVIKLILGSNP